ncbi:hypothetical protein [Trueperella pyogenes]|nr:hypothetical protein [Trueperella pyogenes]
MVRTDIERVYDLPDPISELQDAVGLTRKTIKRILEMRPIEGVRS